MQLMAFYQQYKDQMYQQQIMDGTELILKQMDGLQDLL